MARQTESSLSSEATKGTVDVTKPDGNSLPEVSLPEGPEKSQSTSSSTSTSSRRSRKSGKGRGSTLAALISKTPFRATVNSSTSSNSLSEQSLVANPPLPSVSKSDSSPSQRPLVSTSGVSSTSTGKNGPNGPTFAQIAKRPIRIAKLITSKVTVELTGQEFYLVKDGQDKPFFLDKEIIESKYPHLLRIYRASIRGKLICWKATQNSINSMASTFFY